ncbi:G-D-S-L family lipolytic protein [Flavobacterium sp. 9AF]|uniref:SGNH/GDSL hydrolase family protein n=1 Tax=Flavobacterium sp. 9AF TaxID=2653142 RepID=UPI0012F1B188|nr:G-D-S-L family lipolytic protein [Flavobacterium sp. 9AF]VXB15360.1 G-D-S-L family lipolytic protein [Flavobacterium sp. 9AF]
MKNKFIYLAILAAGFASCEPEFDNPVSTDNYSAGEADFSSYVAVGNSLTAGYMDGTVYKSGQANSFPNLLAQQFALVGGGAFTQPSYEEDVQNWGGIQGIPGFGTRRILDATQPNPNGTFGAVEFIGGDATTSGNSTITLTQQAKAYHNMGVPGAKTFHLVDLGAPYPPIGSNYGNPAGLLTNPPTANPYFVRHATSVNATVLGDALSLNPTFFTCWIGNNDVLGYATSGGVGVNGGFGSADLTSPMVFEAAYTKIINDLTANGAKGVVATIPSVTSIPYFTTVPYNALPSEATATNVNALQLYGFLAQVTGGRILPLSTQAGTKNPVLISDETLSDLSQVISGAASTIPSLAPYASALGQLYGKARQATSSDLIVLPSSGKIGQPNPLGTAPFNVNGVTFPLQDGDVLIPSEQLAITNATNTFNAKIRDIAASKNLAVADMNAILNQLVSGLRADNGTLYTANYFGGGTTEFKVLFSLDGVHPNARGYAVIANEIIKVINTHYKSKLPLLNPNNYPGIHILATN